MGDILGNTLPNLLGGNTSVYESRGGSRKKSLKKKSLKKRKHKRKTSRK